MESTYHRKYHVLVLTALSMTHDLVTEAGAKEEAPILLQGGVGEHRRSAETHAVLDKKGGSGPASVYTCHLRARCDLLVWRKGVLDLPDRLVDGMIVRTVEKKLVVEGSNDKIVDFDVTGGVDSSRVVGGEVLEGRRHLD